MDTISLDPAKLVAGIANGSLDDHPYLPVLIAACAGVCAIMSVFQAAEGDKPPVFSPPSARATGKGLVVTIGDDIDESRGVVAFEPVGLQTQMIAALTNKRDVVVDPTAGGFSTMIAAHSIGRRFLGCEFLKKNDPALQP